MNQIIKTLEERQIRDIEPFEVGNTVSVSFKIKEGEKERIQQFEGVVIATHFGSKNLKASFTVRKVTQGYGVERIFPLHSPKIAKIEVLRKGRIRRAKLYYLRNLFGKAARIKEKLHTK